MVVNAKDLMTELHIDETPEEEATITSLITTATAVVNHAISDLDNAELQTDPLYISAIKALATQAYYDRTLSAGESQGVKALISALEHKYGKANNHATQ